MKNEFAKLGAIHTHNSSLHSGPPSTHANKRSRKGRGKGRQDEIDLANSDEDDNPFTLETRGTRKHEITIKHDRSSSSPSPTSSINTSSSSAFSLSKAPPQSSADNLQLFNEKITLEVARIDKKINVLESIISTFAIDDPELVAYQARKRALLVKKLELYDDESVENLTTPSK